MEFKKVKTALIGSGNISFIYLNTLKNGGFKIIDLVGCSDLIPEKSKLRSEQMGIRQMTNDEILGDPEIEIVLNTTQLWNHNAVTKMILEAGKHSYSEKAMGNTYEGAKANYDLAKAKGLRTGCAPDCYMGSAYQTCRKLVDAGMIGVPLFAQAVCYRGYHSFERPSDPDDAFNSWMGAGSSITYDMAGYYINALVSLLGPVNRVTGYTKYFEGRKFTNPDHPNYHQFAKQLDGQGPTISVGSLEFHSGCYANMVMCQDGYGPEIPRLKIFGSEGVLTCTDPNNFGGWGDDIYLSRIGNSEEFKMPFTHGFGSTDPNKMPSTGKWEACHNSWRGVAVVDMAWAIRRNRPHRSSAELALHGVEIMDAIERSSAENKTMFIESRPERPAPLEAGHLGGSAEASIDNIY